MTSPAFATSGDEIADKPLYTEFLDDSSAASVVAADTGTVETTDLIYQALFWHEDWRGDLQALNIGPDGQPGSVQWRAAENMPGWQDRRLFTYVPGEGGVEFSDEPIHGTVSLGQVWDEEEKEWFTRTEETGWAFDELVDYLRGRPSGECSESSSQDCFRQRPETDNGNPWILGDIVHSSPQYRDPEDAAHPMIYAGANDGMLHGFDASTSGGTEIFGYVPRAVLDNLHELAHFDYDHRYYVDGTPTVMRVTIGGEERTILVGGLRAGGKGIYALDVTNPTAFSEDDVLWDITAEDPGFEDLGFTYSRPAIARVLDSSGNEVWAAIFGNGYHSSDQNTTIYVLNLITGEHVYGGPLTVSGGNGLSTLAVADPSGQGVAVFAYGGDLDGNLWKFQLMVDPEESDPEGQLALAGNGSPLFQAVGPDGGNQPITVRPEVGRGPGGSLLVLFGTGQYFEVGDHETTDVQSLYGLMDTAASAINGRGDLLQQEVIFEGSHADGEQVRVVTNNQLTDEQRGWYLDLPASGERLINNPLLRGGRAIFATLVPSDDPDDFGGTSWLMELMAHSGARLPFTPFDLTGDGTFSEADYVTITTDEHGEIKVPASGLQSKSGILSTPQVLVEGDQEVKYSSGSTGEIEFIRENPGPDELGRQSWRQLR